VTPPETKGDHGNSGEAGGLFSSSSSSPIDLSPCPRRRSPPPLLDLRDTVVARGLVNSFTPVSSKVMGQGWSRTHPLAIFARPFCYFSVLQ
jgi:hypothetical protein